MGDLQRQRAAAQLLELLAGLDRLLPFPLLLVDAAQALQRLDLVARALREAHEKLLGAVQEPGMEIVLRQREQRLVPLLCREVRASDDVLVNANGTVDLAAPPEQAAEREVRLDRAVVDAHHLEE